MTPTAARIFLRFAVVYLIAARVAVFTFHPMIVMEVSEVIARARGFLERLRSYA